MQRSPGERRGSVPFPDQVVFDADDSHDVQTRFPHRSTSRIVLAAVAAWAVLAMLPSLAAAACPPAARADSRATAALVTQLRTAGAAGATDVAELYARARRTCIDLRPVRAIAIATRRFGAPAVGRRATARGVPLLGMTVPGGTAWRLDLKTLAVRVAARPSVANVSLLDSASAGTTARTFAADPTRTSWNPAAQALVAAILGASDNQPARLRADAAVRAVAARGRVASLARLPLLEHLVVANRFAAVGARSGSDGVRTITANVAVRAMVRIRGARARGWSRIDGVWSSAASHRALVAQAGLLLRRHPHAATAAVVDDLRTALRSAPTIDFGTLPVAAFYPWPRDGAFDTQSVTLDVDKPATVSLLVYGAGDEPVRTLSTAVEPGVVTLTWDGADGAGAIQGAGDYRYNVDAVDVVGNRIRVPGLDRFRIARDTTPPVVQTATVRVVGTGSARRIVASWSVTEEHSPQVTTWLLLTSGARTERIQLHDSLQQATVRRPSTLGAGTWRATLVFGDGSGNRVSKDAGSFEIRAGSS